MNSQLIAGAAEVDISPIDSQFLFGYPHVKRYSTGIHDPLLSSAIFLNDGKTPLLMVGNDIIYVDRETVARARERIAAKTGIPAGNILISATHTHSGPLTSDMISNDGDAVVPPTDRKYVQRMEDGIVAAATQAFQNVRPAEIGLAVADGSCVGTHRHDPKGPRIPEVPVLVARDASTKRPIAAMVVCSMHPTVLHEDSTLVSGDFPGMARQYLQKTVLSEACPIVYHTGACGNQSPRHVTRENTFAEAERLGNLLGQSIAKAIGTMAFTGNVALKCDRTFVELPPRTFVSVDEANRAVKRAADRLDTLRRDSADRREVRTAECDWFGAEETLALAKAADSGRMETVRKSVMPAEVSVLFIGDWAFVGWPGEMFVEFALEVKAARKNCHVISIANGELQGYLVTEDAIRESWYEANNSLFQSPESGKILVKTTLELLKKHN
jgi:hypothetical protein